MCLYRGCVLCVYAPPCVSLVQRGRLGVAMSIVGSRNVKLFAPTVLAVLACDWHNEWASFKLLEVSIDDCHNRNHNEGAFFAFVGHVWQYLVSILLSHNLKVLPFVRAGKGSRTNGACTDRSRVQFLFVVCLYLTHGIADGPRFHPVNTCVNGHYREHYHYHKGSSHLSPVLALMRFFYRDARFSTLTSRQPVVLEFGLYIYIYI